jgi:hypothetical protein
MIKILLYLFTILTLARCSNSGGNYNFEVPKAVEVNYHDPRTLALLEAAKKVNRDSMGFAPLDSNSTIFYKDEGSLIKWIFEKPSFRTVLYFTKGKNGFVFEREEETTIGPKKMFVKNVDGYKEEIQDEITRIYDENKKNLLGNNLLIEFLDLDKYPDKHPYNQDSSEFHLFMTEKISIEQARQVITRWQSTK